MQTYQELKSLTRKELLAELEKARAVLMKMRITVKTKHEKDTSAVNKQQKFIARLMTALKEIETDELINEAADLK